MEVYIIGTILGMLLLASKACGYWLLTGGSNPYQIKKWLLFGETTTLRDRIHNSTFLLFCVDAIGGYLGMHVLGAFGGSIVGMIAMASYTIACMTTLMWQFIIKWFTHKFSNILPSSQPSYAKYRRTK